MKPEISIREQIIELCDRIEKARKRQKFFESVGHQTQEWDKLNDQIIGDKACIKALEWVLEDFKNQH